MRKINFIANVDAAWNGKCVRALFWPNTVKLGDVRDRGCLEMPSLNFLGTYIPEVFIGIEVIHGMYTIKIHGSYSTN
jgi:hypothetical protein